MKAQTKSEAIKIKKQLISEGKNASIFKFAGKRKWQFFIGNEWQWLAAIS